MRSRLAQQKCKRFLHRDSWFLPATRRFIVVSSRQEITRWMNYSAHVSKVHKRSIVNNQQG